MLLQLVFCDQNLYSRLGSSSFFALQLRGSFTALSESVSKFLLHCQRLSQSLFNLFCRLTSARGVLPCTATLASHSPEKCVSSVPNHCGNLKIKTLLLVILCHSKVFKINGQITTTCCFTACFLVHCRGRLKAEEPKTEITKS